jgi:hypothetical protein
MLPSETLKLNLCDCGRLHLTYKSVTLHFEKEEFLHYAAHLSRMAMQISRLDTFGQGMDIAGKHTRCH